MLSPIFSPTKASILLVFFTATSLFLSSCAKKSIENEDWIEFKEAVSSSCEEQELEKVEPTKSETILQVEAFRQNPPDTIYINNISGTKVLLEPTEESLTIAELPFNFCIKLIEIEKNAPWCKVNVPRYLRSNGNDEGYIKIEDVSKSRNPLTSLPAKWKAKNLQEYLESCAWKKTGVLQYWIFSTDGTYSRYTPEAENAEKGTWKALNGSSIEINRGDGAEAEALRVRVQDANKCVIGSEYFESKFSLEQLNTEVLDTPIAYSTDSMGYTLLEYAALMNAAESFISSLIKAGVSPGISPYRAEYDDYWEGKRKRKASVKLDWQELPDYWADEYEYLYSSADIDGDGETEGLYSFSDGRKYELALIKPSEKLSAKLFLSAPASYDKSKNPYCELLFPYNLSEKKIFVRIVNPNFSDSLFVVKDGGELFSIYDENDTERAKTEARKIFFSENSVISLDLESSFGVISADNAKQFRP